MLGKTRLTSEVAHELLSPQPQQAMAPLEAGQESRSFGCGTWNTEIPAASFKQDPAAAQVPPSEPLTPSSRSARPGSPCDKTLHFSPRKNPRSNSSLHATESLLQLFCGGNRV